MIEHEPSGAKLSNPESPPASGWRAFRSASDRLGTPRSRRAVWLAVCFVAVGFVAFGRVTVYEADGDERRLSIGRVWSLLGDGLPRIGHGTLLGTVFVASLVVMIAASLAALWLALVSADAPTADAPSRVEADAGVSSHASDGAMSDRP